MSRHSLVEILVDQGVIRPKEAKKLNKLVDVVQAEDADACTEDILLSTGDIPQSAIEKAIDELDKRAPKEALVNHFRRAKKAKKRIANASTHLGLVAQKIGSR